MEKIIFEDSDGRQNISAPNNGFIMNFLIKRGFVKSESSANILMILVSIIFLVIAGYVVYLTFYQ